MKPMYKSLILAAVDLQIGLELKGETYDGSATNTKDIPAEILEKLCVELVSPVVSGARNLVKSGECVVSGNDLSITLRTDTWVKGGTYRVQIKATFGTQTYVIYALDISVPRYVALDDTTQEYDDTVTVVSTLSEAAFDPSQMQAEIEELKRVAVNAKSVTYAQLKEARDNGELVTGQAYRITDYVATVANDADARSAGHAFDVIVVATDANKLGEEAMAALHEGDEYFAGCKL